MNNLSYKPLKTDTSAFITDREVAALMSLDKDGLSRCEVYLSKSGEWMRNVSVRKKFDQECNDAMLLSVWRCWKSDFYTTLESWPNGKYQKCTRKYSFVQRSDYPFLALDRPRFIDGGGIVVLENTTKYHLSKFKEDPNEVIRDPVTRYRAQASLLVTGEPRAEVVQWNGFEVSVFTVWPNLLMFREIEKAVEDWFHWMSERVPMLIEKNDLIEKGLSTDDVDARLQAHEPEPEGTKAYVDFLKDNWQPGKEPIRKVSDVETPDNLELLKYAYIAKIQGFEINQAIEKKNKPLGIINKAIEGYEEIDFGPKYGKITNRVKDGDTRPSLFNSINYKEVRILLEKHNML